LPKARFSERIDTKNSSLLEIPKNLVLGFMLFFWDFREVRVGKIVGMTVTENVCSQIIQFDHPVDWRKTKPLASQTFHGLLLLNYIFE
jgi:hypothetical protein